MKRGAAAFVSGVLLCAASCASKVTHNSFAHYPPAAGVYMFSLSSVAVTIDHINETVVAGQIAKTAENRLKESAPDASLEYEELSVDIIITQRSFLYDTGMYNSIYVSAAARDKNGEVRQFENENISGKTTILSSPEQDKIINRIMTRMLQKNKQHTLSYIKEKELLNAQNAQNTE